MHAGIQIRVLVTGSEHCLHAHTQLLIDRIHLRHPQRGDKGTDQAGYRGGGEEHHGDARAQPGRIPVGEVEDDARQEAALGDAEQGPRKVELVGRRDEHGRGRDRAPDHHDKGDRQPRADLVRDRVARDAEQDDADVEQA